MSKEVARSTSKTEPDVTAEEAIDVKSLAGQGYVLEVTARDPDTIVKNEFQMAKTVKGSIFDYWHHPCSQKDKDEGLCKHKDTPPGDWKKLAAADEKRCVN